MSRYHSYISSAARIIGSYNGTGPLLHHLRDFFAGEKKYGSRDRKQVAALCYSYFRMGHALTSMPVDERILAAYFLTETTPHPLLETIKPAWNQQVALPMVEKMAQLQINSSDIFPFYHLLSDDIEKDLFARSYLIQPALFTRARPGKKGKLLEKLNAANVPFTELNEHCLQLPNNTQLDKIIQLDKEAVVQDKNSQEVFGYLDQRHVSIGQTGKFTAWDCCAASGGKSILLFDKLRGNVNITVSDIRENILANLSTRFRKAGIPVFRKIISDLTVTDPLSPADQFPFIICDAPCTGSGTWARTPEQLYYFDPASVEVYAEKQKKILSSIHIHLRENGLLFYITCSVFKAENEAVVAYARESLKLTLLDSKYLLGYGDRADSMFVAVSTTPVRA